MLRRKRRGESTSRLIVDVYANPTLDLTARGRQVGGPGLYVARMLDRLGVASTVRVIGCIPGDDYVRKEYVKYASLVEAATGKTVFEIREGPRGRIMRVETDCPLPSILESYSGSVAVAAPVYWELSSHILARLPSTYNWVIIDVQGFTRFGVEIENNDRLLTHILDRDRPPNTIVKASIEDLGYSIDTLVEGYVDVVTLGDRGVIAREARDSYLVVLEPVARGRSAIGAGDMFNAAFLVFLAHGFSFAESIAAAHYAVYCLVDNITCTFEDISDAIESGTLPVRIRHVGLSDVLELVRGS